ncbi:Putative inner membrane protein [Salmonella enterica subsp. arizonae]|uniref:Inner membrane protein n=1 Tax=Salmonella enterica subsp. arizonae TaxID=59203 RepID=A0A379S602_SALER|nr:Putative inner membrane protein [Salmonella enterica subsp. arizonae]
MQYPLESLMTAAGILLMAFLSSLLLPAPSLGLALAQKLVGLFHLMDLNQLYTLLFCLWFLLLGALEYWVIRFIWRPLVCAGRLSISMRAPCFSLR